MGYFGIPFRNGVPIGLGSIVGFGAPQEFSPSELFLGGTAGAWYDPSDLSTMFTTSAGTTPVAMPGGGAAVSVGRMLDKSGNGNHAIAFNDTTARPELRARVNLFERSEEFGNAYWTKDNATVAANQTIAPDGTATAELLSETATTAIHGTYRVPAGAFAAGDYLLSACMKQGTARYASLFLNTASGVSVATVDLQDGIITKNGVAGTGVTASISPSMVSLGNGWYRIIISATTAAAVNAVGYLLSDSASPTYTSTATAAYAGNTANNIFIWGADLRPANIGANVPAYQRIADANTYDTSGFPLYLRFDGIDDSMYTPANLNLSGTDKVAVFAGVRKLSDATAGIIAELGSSFGDSGGWYLVNDISPGRYEYSGRGNRVGTLNDAAKAPIAGPDTSVLTAQQDINNNTPSTIRRNGTLAGSSISTTFGGGNFGTYPLYIGSRANSSVWFNGHLHSLIIAGSAVSASNISATEQWVAGKTGLVLP